MEEGDADGRGSGIRTSQAVDVLALIDDSSLLMVFCGRGGGLVTSAKEFQIRLLSESNHVEQMSQACHH
jgi:hypothetical protein